MQQCLYHPEHGYYSDPTRTRTGRGGDFFTSVSVGEMFGRALALAFVPVWEAAGKPEEFWLFEFGAEDGQLAVDILQAAEFVGGAGYMQAIRYGIVEPVKTKRAAQWERLEKSGLGEKAEWLEVDQPLRKYGVVFGNEVFDAQPVRLVEYTGTGWQEQVIVADEAGLPCWRLDQIRGSHELADPIAGTPLHHQENYLFGHRAELRTTDETLLKKMAMLIESGAVLAIDYGYQAEELYSPARTAGTLQCFHRHQKNNDPLAAPGEQDITAHVDFSLLAREGKKHGLDPIAWLTQEKAIAGLLTVPGAGGPDTPRLLEGMADPAKAMRQLQSLMHPEMLGAKFKWLWMTKNLELAPEKMPALKFARPGDLNALF